MELLKSLVRGLMSAGLRLGLIAFAVTLAIVMVFGNPDALKQALSRSGAYDNLIEQAVQENYDKTGDNAGLTSAAITNQQLAQAAKTTFTPAVISDSANQIIDGFYAWLRGEVPEPNFRIDLSDEKRRFIETLANSAADRARQMPACSLKQLRDLANSPPDPLDLPCLPPGYDIDRLRENAVLELSQSGEFLKNPVITAEVLPKNSQGQPIFGRSSAAPQIYNWLVMSPWIIALLSLMAAGGLILLHSDKRRAYKSVAATLLTSGIFLVGVAALYSLVFRQEFRVNYLNNADTFQRPIFEALVNLQSAVSGKVLWIGGIYTILGILGLLALHFNKRIGEMQAETGQAAKPDSAPAELPPPNNFPQ